jgi:predicted alpha/beta hydrolase family esterase
VSGFAVPLGTELNEYFMQEKAIDFSQVVDKLGKAFVLYGDNDPYVNQTALHDLADELHVESMVFHEGGHLNTDAGYAEFPELLNILKGLDNMQPLRAND